MTTSTSRHPLRGDVLGEQPEAMAAFWRLYGLLWSHGTVDQSIKEIARLRNARTTDCAYCRNVRFAGARDDGLTEDRVALEPCRGNFDRLHGLMTTLGEIVAWGELRSAGRQGSASADELIDFGSQKKWRTRMLTVARACQRQVDSDWREFCTAFDDGAFPGT